MLSGVESHVEKALLSQSHTLSIRLEKDVAVSAAPLARFRQVAMRAKFASTNLSENGEGADIATVVLYKQSELVRGTFHNATE